MIQKTLRSRCCKAKAQQSGVCHSSLPEVQLDGSHVVIFISSPCYTKFKVLVSGIVYLELGRHNRRGESSIPTRLARTRAYSSKRHAGRHLQLWRQTDLDMAATGYEVVIRRPIKELRLNLSYEDCLTLLYTAPTGKPSSFIHISFARGYNLDTGHDG